MGTEIQIEATTHPKIEMIRLTLQRRSAHHCRALGQADAEISVVLCDDSFIRPLNAQWRGEDHATDVLSFPMFEDPSQILPGMPLGDIVISVEYAQRCVARTTHRDRVAAQLGVCGETLSWGIEDEVEFLFIHGLLHLVGHDHAHPEEEAAMKAQERELWLSVPGREV